MPNKHTYREVMNMNEEAFTNLVCSNAAGRAWVKEAADRTEVRRSYPRKDVYDEKKGKVIYVADKTATPVENVVPISFMSLKKAYCAEVAKIAPAAKSSETFRERMKAAAEKG